jgi:hypothetical protein
VNRHIRGNHFAVDPHRRNDGLKPSLQWITFSADFHRPPVAALRADFAAHPQPNFEAFDTG